MRPVKTVTAASLFSLVLAIGCASAPGRTGVITIGPSEVHQACVEAAPDEALEYSFEASLPVAFKILYREEGSVFYSYSKENVFSDKGVFYPERLQLYCLAWTNLHDKPVNLSYTYAVRR
ncbi:MAG: hypothetical protein M1497_06435 [Nitrospirae bacterium]|nr:hypothetical protein [Nitrospirota bacterium]